MAKLRQKRKPTARKTVRAVGSMNVGEMFQVFSTFILSMIKEESHQKKFSDVIHMLLISFLRPEARQSIASARFPIKKV
jgi:hypothetical protein